MFDKLAVVLCFFYVLWRLWFKKPSAAEPPELYGRLPIVGHAYLIIKGTGSFGEKVYNSVKGLSMEYLKKGVGIFTLHMGPKKIYDPEISFKLMDTCLDKIYFADYLKPLIGNGLLTSDAVTWKKHRKLLNPAFNQQVLNSFIEVFNTQAENLVDTLATGIGKPFDHQKVLRINFLKTICLTSFGTDTSEYDDLHEQYLPLLHNLLENAVDRTFKFWLRSDLIYNMTRQKKQQAEDLKNLTKLSKMIIKRKKSERANQTNTVNKEVRYKAFMDLILDLAHETGCFTDEQIREHTDTVIFGGHDTSAGLLTYALTILGSRTDIQEKAYEEVYNVLGDCDKHINKDDLSKLVYMEAILKETLRLHPVVPILGRNVDQDVKLKNCTVTESSDIIVSIYGIHRHSIWGPDADQFQPERWFDKETLPDPKYFGGFGLGRRSCPGKTYAMMSMKIALAHVLRNYRVSSDISKMVDKLSMTASPESGYYITLELRNK